MKIYVGNLSYSSQEEDVRQIFASYGEVQSVDIITDRGTGRSKGFAFVEMENQEQGEKAIEELNDTDLQGRNIRVSVARPKTRDNSRRRFNGGGNRSGGGDRNRRFNNSRF